jgi:hypothetical protein
MASTLGDFTLSAVAAPDDFIVGYDEAALNGERRWTVSTIANAVSGIITPALVETPAFTGTFKNKIINGNFDIWQRGTSLGSGTGVRYLADRFVNSSNGSTYTVSRQSFSNGQADVPNNPSYFHRTVVSSVAGNGNSANFATTIESVKNLAGKTATLSFYAKADSNKSVSVEFQQFFGTGGSPSSQVTGIGVQKLNLTSSWQNFTVTVNIPSIAGKTIGTNNNDYLAVAFWFDAGSNWNSNTNSLGQQSGTFDIAQVQLEEGSVATPFENRPIGTELALCQRYYFSLASISGSRWDGAGSYSDFTIVYPVPMRSIPTVSATFGAGNSVPTVLYDSAIFRATAGNHVSAQNVNFLAEL